MRKVAEIERKITVYDTGQSPKKCSQTVKIEIMVSLIKSMLQGLYQTYLGGRGLFKLFLPYTHTLLIVSVIDLREYLSLRGVFRLEIN